MVSSDEDMEEWKPPESTKATSKTARGPAAGGMKAAPKRTAKPKEPKGPKQPKVPKVPKDPKPTAPRKRAAEQNDTAKSASAGTKRKKTDEDDLGENKIKTQADCPEEQKVDNSGTSVRMKEEVIIKASSGRISKNNLG